LPVLESVDGQSVRVIISALGVNRVRRFFKQLSKLAEVRAYDLPEARKMSEQDLFALVEEKALEIGLPLPREVIERLARVCGLDMRTLTGQLQKLRTFVGSRPEPLTSEEARWLIRGEQESEVWDYCDAVLRGQPKLALEELQALLRQGQSEVGLLIMLGQQVRLAALASVLLENKLMSVGPRGADVAAAGIDFLPRKKSGETVNLWQLGQVAQKSKGRSAHFWLRAVDHLFRVNQQLVTGAVDKERALELLTLELAAP
jgi:DNA polymerase III subunit delta